VFLGARQEAVPASAVAFIGGICLKWRTFRMRQKGVATEVDWGQGTEEIVHLAWVFRNGSKKKKLTFINFNISYYDNNL
jgi:hypothetical protein